MSKKRGLSLEEKCKIVRDIFHDSKEVFALKDIEKLAPKKGVIQQSVKDVLQSLVDDDLVHQEKIGSSNYFWSFPSEAAVKLENNLQALEAKRTENRQLRVNLQKDLDESSKGKEESAERVAKLNEKSELEVRIVQQQQELAQYADNDPERFRVLHEACGVAKDAANRWLDNIDMLRKWLKKRFEGQEQQLEQFFKENGATDDMEYLT